MSENVVKWVFPSAAALGGFLLAVLSAGMWAGTASGDTRRLRADVDALIIQRAGDREMLIRIDENVQALKASLVTDAALLAEIRALRSDLGRIGREASLAPRDR